MDLEDMRGIGPYIVAIGIVVAGILVPALRRSRHPLAQRLVRSHGPRARGPNGTWLRADHLRAAGRQAAIALGLWIVALAIFGVADRWPVNTTPNTAISLPGLALMFGGMVALWFAGRSLLRAATGYRGAGKRSMEPDIQGESSRPAV